MLRIAIIDRTKCKAPDKCDYICMRVCPIQKNNIKVFEIGGDKKPIILEDTCIGCGICVKKCLYGAIKIINLTKEPDVYPVYQYGPNSFRLYRLPIPKQGTIIGILGRNGIGKTTAIKILAGLLKPNLGRYDKPPSEKEILEYFKGTELHRYFIKLFNNEIRLSYKPQDLILFIRLYGEKKVEEILSRFDDNKVKEVLQRLNIQHITTRRVKELSGGELQKLLIAITSLKEAEVYFFDEPTAFLDIYERLNSAIYIGELKRNDNTIFVVDHDLLFMDYLSDIIHIVYGIPKAYGVFSYPIGAKEGINQYLDGFIRRENLRIRDKPIRIDIKSYSEKKSDKKLIEWEGVYINLGEFTLEAKKGFIYEYEIVGVVGRNGIGKSTFAKALVGIIQYSGTIRKNIESIGYKPQYLELPDEIKYLSVNEFLTKMNPEYKHEYNEYLVELGIADMLDLKLVELSGGNLQTVITFGTLIQNKDFYVLDEPFAFLDIEQRLRISKFIREIIKQKEKSCLVIEHDLIFLDYISDRILVFLGEPGKHGMIYGPYDNRTALNLFLKEVGITVRRDKETGRPKINKPGSYLDRAQKARGEYYAS